MERDNLIQIVTLIIAIVALILALFSVVVPEGEEDTDDTENEAPIANIAVASTTVEEMESLLFDASGSTDSDGVIVEYSWDFGDGGKDSGMYTNYAYPSADTFTVTLTVMDNDGESATTSIDIIVNAKPVNVPPVASILLSPTSTDMYEHVNCDGSSSIDSDGTIVMYHWDFGDGTNATGIYMNHHYTSFGTFTITLTVTDDRGGTDSESGDIVVNDPGGPIDNDPPVASFEVEDITIYEEKPVQFNASGSSDTDGAIVEYSWDFGDGNGGSGKYIEYSFTDDGEFNVTLTVYDNDGASDSDYEIVMVEPKAPTGTLDFTRTSYGNYTGGIISLSDQLKIADAYLTIFDDSIGASETQNPINIGTPFQVGTGLKLTFYDSNGNMKIDGGDVWEIENGSHSDVIKLLFITDETVAEYTINEPAPTGALSFTENTVGNYTGGLIALSDELYISDASITIIDVSTSDSASQDPVQSGVTLQAGSGLNLTYTDSNGNGKMDAGDVWVIKNGASGDVIKLIHKTGKSVAEYTLS
jgi:PKD repeat protein